MIHFVTYGNHRYRKSRARVSAEARWTGLFDVVHAETETSITQDQAFRAVLEANADFRTVFTQKRGAGFWIWKPYVIYKHLENLKDGDILVYTDAGSTIPPEPSTLSKFNKLFQEVRQTQGGVLSFEIVECKEQTWTKSDVLVHFGCVDNQSILTTGQREAGRIHVVRKCTESVMHYRQWWDTAKKQPFLFDNTVREKQNKPGFHENRHDQSIWSILCKLNNIPAYPVKDSPIIPTRIKG